MVRKVICVIFLMLAVILMTASVSIADPKLVWDPSSGEVSGYRIYYGTAPGSHPNSHDVGNVTEYPLTSLPLEEKQTYYFVTRAYNAVGESGDSNEVSWTVPDMTAPLPPQQVSVQ
ncbi:MAG: fibronectin type III domain-containing protein [Deltaproteobacteria bacterium]|nr:fibronectin type III domain-containing protein [Deltaproteobacteria bacterium]MBW1930715.1 fibronectin type III domain-containing protein [Deltaproteobacteria bacterium]MBW2026300.1 fibronectin type III domain-containing protein [Deltaproteobacteria bacterium]MBW2126432.1 fibronectin type III domain-containing protein [Deltaproteobacteria bacterium]